MILVEEPRTARRSGLLLTRVAQRHLTALAFRGRVADHDDRRLQRQRVGHRRAETLGDGPRLVYVERHEVASEDDRLSDERTPPRRRA